MASEEKSFEDLLKEAPSAPAAGTVSLVGTLAQSSEAGKFVLTLQDGSAVTLETASVKNYAVLGTSVGQTIVRVDVDAAKIPTISPIPWPWASNPNPSPWVVRKPPWLEHPKSPSEEKPAWLDKPGWEDGNIGWLGPTPFALATPQQVPPGTLAALQGAGVGAFGRTVLWLDNVGTHWWWDLGTPGAVDVLHTAPRLDAGATNPGGGFLD